MEVDGELCSRCGPIFSTLENLTNLKYRHGSQGYRHYKRHELMASASKGCKLCTILWSEARSSWRNEDNREILFRAHSDYFVTHEQSGLDVHPFSNAGKDLFINVSFLSADDGHEAYITTFIPITTADDNAANYIEGRPIPNDLSDRQSQIQIQTWLRDCQKNHQCSEDMALPKLPTRVLDLSKSQPRLHVSARNERSQYACLSYCWGGAQEVLTIKANLNKHVKRLPMNKLPKTLQDAISVSKTLGLRYLWIDALCIIQNSLEDKAAEINKMGSIYRDATVTIFATSASRVGDGFLQYRPSDEGGVLLPFYVSDSSQGTVTLLLRDSPYAPNEPLDSRAWVIQETLLSRRRLIYGTKELLWKCQEDSYQTLTVSPRAYDMLVTSLPNNIFSSTQNSDVNRQKEADNSHAESWSVIVRNFTSRGITNREDRLLAIGGVAAELQRLWKDDYIVGAWRRTLAQHLMWYRVKSHPSASLPRPVEYRSPSWSWASVDYAVDFRPVEFINVEVISCNVQLKSSLAPFGSAVGGELVLKAKILTMTHMEPETVSGWKVIQDVESELTVESNTVFVLFGFHNGQAHGISLKVNDDRTFLRTGSFSHEDSVYKFRGDRSCVWKRPEVTIQELRIF